MIPLRVREGHRDSGSELVGDGPEIAIETLLTNADISYRKTKRAERVPGFHQAPDFIIPDELCTSVCCEGAGPRENGRHGRPQAAVFRRFS